MSHAERARDGERVHWWIRLSEWREWECERLCAAVTFKQLSSLWLSHLSSMWFSVLCVPRAVPQHCGTGGQANDYLNASQRGETFDFVCMPFNGGWSGEACKCCNDDGDAGVRSMRADKRNNIHPNLINPFYVRVCKLIMPRSAAPPFSMCRGCSAYIYKGDRRRL